MLAPNSNPVALFTTRSRIDSAPKREGESRFGFLDRVAGPFWDRLRSMIDTWFASYPVAHATDLLARVQSDDDQLDAAWWELYLHQVLTGTGRTVIVHPDVAGSVTHPDFLVREQDGTCWYLEARLLQDGGAAEERRVGQILDGLNEVRSPNFFLGVNFRRIGSRSPSLSQLRQGVERWLDSLDPDAVLAAVDSGSPGRGDLPHLPWKHDDWSVLLQAIPKKREARGRDGGRTVGMHGGLGGRWVGDDHQRIKRVLSEKAKKYGDLSHPLVLALRLTSPYSVLSHLFGDRRASESASTAAIPGGATAQRRVGALLLASAELQRNERDALNGLSPQRRGTARALFTSSSTRCPASSADSETCGANGAAMTIHSRRASW